MRSVASGWPARLVVPFVLIGACVATQSSPSVERPEDLAVRLDGFVERAMERIGAVPGLAVAVVDTGGVLVERTWGLRDVEADLPVTPETGFYIASSTKSYVALLTVLLDRRGELDLDAPLTACIPELDLNGVTDPASETLRDQLRHTQMYESNPVNTRTAYTDFMDPEELLRVLADWTFLEDDVRRLLGDDVTREDIQGHPPFGYDNIGYIMADLCFRTRFDRSWKELLEAEVLRPVGLTSTTPYISVAAGTGDLARPYLWDGTRFRAIPPKTDAIMHAAGGLVTTVRDAGRWIRLHLGDGRIDGERLVPTDAVREVLTRQTDADLSFWEFSRDGYGLGWYDGTYRGDRLVHHFGGYPGAQAHISMMPGHGIGVAALINGGGAGGYLLPHIVAAYAYDLMLGRPDAEERAWAAVEAAAADAAAAAAERKTMWDRLARQKAAPPPSAHAPARYLGLYRHGGAGVVSVSALPGGRLFIDWGAAREGDLVPAGGDVFLADWEPGLAPDTIEFVVPAAGPADGFRWEGLLFGRVPRGEGVSASG